MTEGPSARAIADRMRAALEGRRLDSVTFRTKANESALVDDLAGRRVLGVENHGKNLLVHVEGGRSFRIHLLMGGRVDIGPEFEDPGTPVRLALHAEGVRVAVVGAPKIELLPSAELSRRRKEWGPDATKPDFDRGRFLEGLAAAGTLSVGEALLDQSIVAGVGNKWKCEILHAARVDPRTPVRSLTSAERGRIVELVPTMLAEAYERRREGRSGPVRVYHRSGHPCRACGALILFYRLGGRSTYSCPVCQPKWEPREKSA